MRWRFFASIAKEVERALENAVRRGLFVHALIADTNRSGEITCASPIIRTFESEWGVPAFSARETAAGDTTVAIRKAAAKAAAAITKQVQG